VKGDEVTTWGDREGIKVGVALKSAERIHGTGEE
jgi:hypothetical protein